MNEQIVLEIKNLKTYFYTYEGIAKAVDGVSYQLAKGEPLGVVGESGCHFHTRCPQKIEGLCQTAIPEPREIRAGHFVACHLY